MKIQLVFAPPSVPARYGELGERISPPLGILYLAGYLRQRMKDIDISVIDGARKGYQYTLSQIEYFRPDVLGISYLTPVALSAYKLADDVKRLYPNTLVLLGGAHATALPEEGLDRSRADAVVMGEGELTVFEIIKKFKNKGTITQVDYSNIEGFAYRNNGKIYFSSPRKFIHDLNTVPFPARDLIKMTDYSGWFIHKQLPETKMIMSRGCPYHCTFCADAVWKSSKPWVRLRSPQNIVDEIESLMEEHDIREIADDSDEFNNNLSHALAICEELKSRELNIPWKTQIRAWPLPEKLVKAMAEAGCWYVHLGIESGNPETLRGIKKQITIEQVIEACKLLKKYGIQVLGLFMLFNVWEEDGELRFENVEKTRKTFHFIQNLVDQGLLSHIGWSVTTPYPGSTLYKIALKHELIKPELRGNWDAWLREDTFIMKLPGVDEPEMARMKTLGQILRAKLLLRSHRFGLKDLRFFAQKGLKLIHNELRSRFRSRKRYSL